jgi:putative endonuclease
MKDKNYFVYVLASKKNGMLYIDVTDNLFRRVLRHKDKIIKGFTEKYGIDKLVYYESFDNAGDAKKKKEHIKALLRKNKMSLIERSNKGWKDLFYDLEKDSEMKYKKKMKPKKKEPALRDELEEWRVTDSQRISFRCDPR